jgi:soluble lytic murein transglycosylase
VKRILGMVVLAGALLATFVTLQSSKPGWWERLWYPLSYQQIVRGHARNYDLDPALLAAVIYQESKFKPNARSTSGAIGLMQLLPDTAKGIALHTGGSKFRVEDLYNPEINVRYGAWYLRHLLEKYGDERDALAAYNAGQDNVDRWRRAGQGIQFAETRAYVTRVEELKRIYRRAYGAELGTWGEQPVSLPAWLSILNWSAASELFPRMSATLTAISYSPFGYERVSTKPARL